MTTSPPPSANLPYRSTSSHGIFSRLAAPFLGKSRSFADFEINLDEPLKEYKAGDAVKGRILLVVPKPVRITHLVLSLHGFAKVFKNVAAPGEGLPSDVRTPSPGRGNTGVEYLGNGLVSLFEDEMILCGMGKLNVGQYSFEFEARFPSKSLPSSLSFERGTISYVLVATLTRPTTIAPTMSREKEVQFRELLDISAAPRPRQRVLQLKALNRSRHLPRRTLTDRTINSSSNTNQSSTDSSDNHERPRSSTASETSHESGLDSVVLQSVHTPSRTTFSSDIPASPSQSPRDTITATVDLLRGGYLPGDYVPIRICVKHTKPLKSMHGVIVTLYRKAKIDAFPAIREGSSSSSGSRGSLSQIGSLRGRSSHLYRMDLAQAFAPMVVNPMTLEADIKTAVKVPDDAFPTVSNVPGQMIVFTYHVEIIMDLGGKLSKYERLLSGMNMTSQAPVFSMGAQASEQIQGTPLSLEIYHLIDTHEIRREKGVGQETFEILIGSADSKRKAVDVKKLDLWVEEIDDTDSTLPINGELQSQEETIETPNLAPQYQAARSNETLQPTFPLPLPQISSPGFEEPLDEKARIRLAEQRLLPSAPPDSADFATSSATVPFAIPSAPLLSDLELHHMAGDINGVTDLENLGPTSDDEIVPAYEREMHSITCSSSGANLPIAATNTDDKAELERQRLMAMASSPDDQGGDSDPALDTQILPSAPILEDDTLLTGDTHHPPQTLPGYIER